MFTGEIKMTKKKTIKKKKDTVKIGNILLRVTINEKGDEAYVGLYELVNSLAQAFFDELERGAKEWKKRK